MGFTKLIEPIVKVQMGAFYSLINTHYFFDKTIIRGRKKA